MTLHREWQSPFLGETHLAPKIWIHPVLVDSPSLLSISFQNHAVMHRGLRTNLAMNNETRHVASTSAISISYSPVFFLLLIFFKEFLWTVSDFLPGWNQFDLWTGLFYVYNSWPVKCSFLCWSFLPFTSGSLLLISFFPPVNYPFS